MYSRNRIELIGHLGADPEMLFTPKGKKYARLRLATTERWKGDDGQQHEATEWHRVILWGGQAEVAAKYTTKGSYIMVEGSLSSSKYADKDGVERTGWQVRGLRLGLLEPKRDAPADAVGDGDLPPPPGDDDVPF